MTTGRCLPWYLARRIDDPQTVSPSSMTAMIEVGRSPAAEWTFSVVTAQLIMPDESRVPALIASTPFTLPHDWFILAIEHIATQHGLTDELTMPYESEQSLFNYLFRQAIKNHYEMVRTGRDYTVTQKNLQGVPVNLAGKIIHSERSN